MVAHIVCQFDMCIWLFCVFAIAATGAHGFPCMIHFACLASYTLPRLVSSYSSAAFYSDGTAVITLFSDSKEYEVNAQGECQSFCPLPDYPMQPFGIPSDATDKGPEKYNGKDAELWTTTSEFPVLNVTMSTMSFYVNGKTDATPVAFVQQLTPFGQPLGGSTTMFSDWTNGAPDASRFVVKGKDTCKEAQNCGGSSGGSSSGSHKKHKDDAFPPSDSSNHQARYLEAVDTPFGYAAPSELRSMAARRASQE